MLLCSYENQTGKTIDPKQLEDGTLQLKDLLTEEDFAMACSVRLLIISLMCPTSFLIPQSQCVQPITG